jgi:hypothetical protein
MCAEITWGVCEWHDDPQATSSYLEPGVAADVYPDPRDGKTLWTWRVDLTSAVSEWPEVWDMGQLPSREDAMAVAEMTMREAANQVAPRARA